MRVGCGYVCSFDTAQPWCACAVNMTSSCVPTLLCGMVTRTKEHFKLLTRTRRLILLCSIRSQGTVERTGESGMLPSNYVVEE